MLNTPLSCHCESQKLLIKIFSFLHQSRHCGHSYNYFLQSFPKIINEGPTFILYYIVDLFKELHSFLLQGFMQAAYIPRGYAYSELESNYVQEDKAERKGKQYEK